LITGIIIIIIITCGHVSNCISTQLC
jgi:hypothetical protein